MRKVLLLNADGETLNLIPWTRAMTMVFLGKVRVYEYFAGVEVKSARQSWPVPSVVALVKYIVIPGSRKVALTKKNLLIRDGFSCAYCARSLSQSSCTVDHVIPTRHGGKKLWQNVVASCKPCNAKKADRTPAGARMKLLVKPFIPTRSILLKQCAEKDGYFRWEPYFHRA